MQALRKRLGQPVGNRLRHDRVVVVVRRSELVAQFLQSKPARHRKCTDRIRQPRLLRRNKIRQAPARLIPFAIRLLPQKMNLRECCLSAFIRVQLHIVARRVRRKKSINAPRSQQLLLHNPIQQRVPFSVRDEALSGLRDWWADRLDWGGFNQLAGNLGPSTPALTSSDIRWTGLQATIAPDSNHYTNAQAGANDTTLGSTNIFSLSMIDKAIERAKTLTPAIRPIQVGGKKFYVGWLHPYQVTDLRTSTSTGQWLDIQKAAMTGGLVDDNPIFDGSLGVYNGCILHEDARVPQGYNPSGNAAITTVRRAVFCGAQAGMIGFGRDNSVNKFTWVEELFDYENQLGVSAGLIWGLKKTVFNSADFATIVMSSYATTH